MILFNCTLLACLAAGVISEILTIAAPGKILEIVDLQPEEILQSRFYKYMFMLSAFYLIGIVLMFFAGDAIFRIYALLLLCNSVVVWVFKGWLRKFNLLFIAESTLCLILLLDACRVIVRELAPIIKRTM
jgi:hypothetical protein